MNATNTPPILDTPTIDAMLREEGVPGTGMDFNLHRYLGIEVDLEQAQTLDDDERLAFKDEILRTLDTRLTKLLGL
jgi:hypothetical protein